MKLGEGWQSNRLLELAVLVPLELVTLGGDVHPETAVTTYRAGALDLEAHAVCRLSGRRQVDVCSWHVWSASICQWQQIYSLRGWLLGGRHGAECN